MKKLSYEGGHLVLREMDGTLCWSSHWIDMKKSYDGGKDQEDFNGGGYKTILIEGVLTEQNDFQFKDKVVKL